MLRNFSKAQGLEETGTVTAIDYMDDGTPIALSVTIDRKEGSAVFDFEGTGPEVYNSCNAPPAVTYSAIIYSLRCMVRSEIPLNQVNPPHIQWHLRYTSIFGAIWTSSIRVSIPPLCADKPSLLLFLDTSRSSKNKLQMSLLRLHKARDLRLAV